MARLSLTSTDTTVVSDASRLGARAVLGQSPAQVLANIDATNRYYGGSNFPDATKVPWICLVMGTSRVGRGSSPRSLGLQSHPLLGS